MGGTTFAAVFSGLTTACGRTNPSEPTDRTARSITSVCEIPSRLANSSSVHATSCRMRMFSRLESVFAIKFAGYRGQGKLTSNRLSQLISIGRRLSFSICGTPTPPHVHPYCSDSQNHCTAFGGTCTALSTALWKLYYKSGGFSLQLQRGFLSQYVGVRVLCLHSPEVFDSKAFNLS